MRGIIISIVSIVVVFISVILEGAHLESFFHWVFFIVFLPPVVLGYIFFFMLKKEPLRAKKYLASTMNLTWIIAFTLSAIAIIYVFSRIYDSNAAQLGHGIALTLMTGLWAAIANVLVLLPLFTEASLSENQKALESSTATVNGLGSFALCLLGLFAIFCILYALSGGSDGSEAQSAGGTADLSITVHFHWFPFVLHIFLWLIFLLALGLPNRLTQPGLWILSGGFVLGSGSIGYLIGFTHVLENLGNATAYQLFAAISYINGVFSVALIIMFLSILIAVIFGIIFGIISKAKST